jgi:hypothetical protein
MPNWFVHDKWAQKAGIDLLISSVVNRFIDYGAHYGMYDENDLLYNDENDSNTLRQLKYFYQRDIEKKFSNDYLYVRAYYLHHLLDYFKETRFNILDLELIFIKYLEEKVIIEFSDKRGIIYNFQNEVNKIFQILRENAQELYDDLKGNHLKVL